MDGKKSKKKATQRVAFFIGVMTGGFAAARLNSKFRSPVFPLFIAK